MCRRELTRQNWSYVAITTLNEFRRNVICIEGLFFDDDEKTYAFVCNSLKNMAPGRPSSDVFAFAGDGYFSQELVTSLGFVNASFIHDRWHLLENIKAKMGQIYMQVKVHIHDMINAETALQCDDSVRLLKSYIPSSNVELVKYIDDISSQKATFSKYLLQKILGTLFLVGSSISEQNHASIMAFLRANSGLYQESLQQFACDLFKRQKERTSKLKMEISKSLVKRMATRAEIYSLSYSSSEKDEILFPAFEYLKLPSYELFMKEFEQSIFYICEEQEDTFVIRRSGVNGKDRIISKVPSSRCMCPTLLALGGMCRHELSLHRKFIPSLFKECHRLRNEIPISRNIGNWMNRYDTLTDEGIVQSQAACNEGEEYEAKDRVGHNIIESSTEENDNMAYHEDREMNDSDCETVDHEKINSQQKTVRKYKFCRIEGHIEANCGVKANLGRMVDSVTFLTYVLCDSTFRYQTEHDTVKQHLPDGIWFLCCCGVICKTNRLTIPSRFEWSDIVIVLKCISDCGLEIEQSLYAGESVDGFIRLHGRRQLFISDRENTGPEWNARKSIEDR